MSNEINVENSDLNNYGVLEFEHQENIVINDIDESVKVDDKVIISKLDEIEVHEPEYPPEETKSNKGPIIIGISIIIIIIILVIIFAFVFMKKRKNKNNNAV